MSQHGFAGVVVMVLMFIGVPTAYAQIPPLDDVTDQIEDAVDETVDTVGENLGEAVEEISAGVEQTGSGAGNVGSAGGVTDATSSGSTSSTGGDGSGGDGAAIAKEGPAGSDRRSPSDGRGSAERSRSEVGAARMAGPLAEATAAVSTAAYIPVQVRLINDADGDGSYRDAESAPRPGADVPLRVLLENVGPGELDIAAVRHATSGPSANEPVCPDLAGFRLVPGGSAGCGFTVEGLAPDPGVRVVAVVEVDVVETADPSAGRTVTDASVVRTEAVGVLGAVARRALDSLASTGGRIGLLVVLSVGLGMSGVWMLRVGNGHGRRIPSTTNGLAPRRVAAQRSPRRRPRLRPILTGHAAVRRGVGTARR